MNRTTRTGLFALVVLGGIYLYRNRFEVQRFLESQGIKTPLATSGIGETIKSGIAKVSGRLKHETDLVSNEVDEPARSRAI
jgi:hypothetical protein